MKNNLQDNHNRKTDYLCYFQHRFAFCVFNLHEVVSVELINTRANYYKPVGSKGYFWARYEVQISYRCAKDRGNIRQKVFSRGCVINDPHSLPANSQENQPAYICEATVSYQAAPFLLMLFPLLNWIEFVPIKIRLNVAGKIRESAEERVSDITECARGQNRDECACLGKATYDPKDGEDKTETAAEQGKNTVDLDLIALEENGMSLEPGESNIHTPAFKRFYNMLVEHEQNIRHQLERKAATQINFINKKEQRPRGI